MDLLISGLVKKRAEIAGSIKQLQSDLRHIDGTLVALGYSQPNLIRPVGKRRNPPLFQPGELMRLVGEAQRAGLDTPKVIVDWIMSQKGWDSLDTHLVERMRLSVKDCRKRMKRKLGD